MQISYKNIALETSIIVNYDIDAGRLDIVIHNNGKTDATLSGNIKVIADKRWLLIDRENADFTFCGSISPGQPTLSFVFQTLADILSKLDLVGVRDDEVALIFNARPDGQVIIRKCDDANRASGEYATLTTDGRLIIKSTATDRKLSTQKELPTRTEQIKRLVSAQGVLICTGDPVTVSALMPKLRDLHRLLDRCTDEEYDAEVFAPLVDNLVG